MKRIIPDYVNMNAGEMLAAMGTDAQKWAEAFCQIKERTSFKIDEALMTGWFANAIEAARISIKKD